MMFCVDNVFSQEGLGIWYNNVSIPPSPNAASLGQYGEIPVDKSVGLIDISIPVMTIGTGNLSIPITISYHGGGIKVNESSSLVGLGWALNAGGVITRSVDGRPDDMYRGFLSNCDDIPNKSTVAQEVQNPDVRLETFDMLEDVSGCLMDYKPDKFFFNFPGHSGSFVFNNNGNTQLISYDEIKIIPELGIGGVITGFIITDENGIKYYFGNFDDNLCTEYSEITTDQPNIPGYNSSWYLNKIIDVRTNKMIRFYYDSYTYMLPVINSHTRTYVQGLNSLYTPEGGARTHFNMTSIQNSRCISQITFEDNIISFANSSSTEEGRKIDTITWVNRNLERKFVFDYSSFESDRLKLDGMREISGGLEKEYIFEYNDTDLPAINSNSQDFGGYYNGVYNSTLIPRVEYGSQTFGDADRSPNEYYSKACILEKITYPTGGYSEFEYGLNEFGESETFSDLDAACGLRIEQIKNYDPVSNKIYYRTFDYCSSGYSTQTNPAKYYLETKNVVWEGILRTTENKLVFYSTPVAGLGASATNVAYDKVDEYSGTESDNIGKTSTKFYHALDHGANKLPYPPRFSNQWKRSKLTQEKQFEYDSEIESYYLVSQRDYTYSLDDRFSSSINCFHATQIVTEEFDYLRYPYFFYTLNYFLYDNYIINTSRLRLDAETTQEITNNDDTIRVVRNYYYDNHLHLNPTRIEWIDSKANEEKVVMKYPMDYTSCTADSLLYYDVTFNNCLLSEYANSTGNVKAIYYMNLSNITNAPIEKISYVNEQETEHIKWNYEITPDNIVTLSSTEKSYGGEPLITEITYDQYDYRGNPGVVVEKEDGLETSYIWGYSNTVPVAKVVNAKYTPVDYLIDTITVNISSSLLSPAQGIALSSFTIGYFSFAKKVSFTIDNIFDDNTPALPDILIIMTIKEISSGETVSTCEFTSGNLYKEVNLEPGSYRIEYSKNANISYNCDFKYITVTKNIGSTRISEAFYESFEDMEPGNNAVPKTGNYVYCGEYSVPLSDKIEGTYKLTYWTSNDGINWGRNDSAITVDEYSTTLNIGSAGVYLDEIRLHPPDAQMTTYTYDPLIGMTSETDPNGLTTYYEYDSFGRLEYIKDNDHNILKAYRYHYADQEQ